MFCHKCGTRMPENARFCPACGTMIPRGPKKPTTQNIYTAPIQREQVPDQTVQPHVEQSKPQPVHIPMEQLRQQNQIPIHDPSAYNPQPVRPNTAPAPSPKQPKQQKKGGSKLPILLALIAAIAALIFFGGKKEPEMEPERIVVVDRSKPRYDSEGFVLSHQEFEAIYLSMLEENGISVKKKGMESNSNMGRTSETSHLICQGDRPVRFTTSTYDHSGKVWHILLTFRFKEGEIVDLNESQKKAMLLFYEAIHGPIEKENWESFIKENKVQEEDCIVSELKIDGLLFEFRRYDNALMARAKVDEDWWEQRKEEPEIEETEETIPETTEAPKPEPASQRNFDEESFLFGAYGFMDEYQLALDEADLPFELELSTPTDEHSVNALVTYEGRQVGILTTEENDSGKMKWAILTMNLTEDEQWNRSCIDTGLTLFYAGHGALTGAHMDQINNTEPVQYTSGYVGYHYDLDGMKALTIIYPDKILYEISIE